MTNPNLNRLKRTPTASPRPRFQLGSAFFRHSNFPRHSGASFRHPGESRNLRAAIDFGFRQNDGSTPRHVVIFTVIPASPAVIPAPSTVIPAQAGIYACRLHCRLPQPSFRRKPESMPAGPITDSPNHHSGASRNPGRTVTVIVSPAPRNLPGLGCPATIDIPASPFAIIMAWSI